jgi:nucleoid DNA-binding protein
MAKGKTTPAKAPASKSKPMTKSAFFTHLAEVTELKKTDVVKVYEALVDLVTVELKKTQVFTLPDVAKLRLKHVPGVKGGEKKVMRATGQEYVTKAKKAHNKVRVIPVKKLKDAVA